ncbi:hypothetical protein [Paraburkholderia sp. MM5482-R1]|uniref:hypothetical protein n=1 Tax=unclassified Paraburkholderia TaxID=2615204 RepID=UPI003D224818
MDAATFRERHKDVWGDNPADLMAKYKYLPEITAKIDNTPNDGLNQQRLFEIALWKVNRYPVLSDELLAELWALKNLAPGVHRGAKKTLCAMLACRGIQLPMASTFLRFVNPKAFQIYDERAARMLWGPGHAAAPNKSASRVAEYIEAAADHYFEYLDDLRAICSPELPFESADRILYQLDIELGNKLKRR